MSVIQREPESHLTYWETVSLTKWGRYVSEIEQNIVMAAEAYCPSNGSILDLGCDGGRWSVLLSRRGREKIICTDTNPEALMLCRKRIPEAVCVQVSPEATTVPCRTGSIDLLLCVEVPSVIQSHWFTDEADRVLAKDGLLVGVVQNRFSYRSLLHFMKKNLTAKNGKRYGTYYGIAYSQFRNELLSKGFEILEQKGCCWLPFSRSSNCSFIPQLVKIEKYLKLESLPAFSPWVVFIMRKK